MTDGPDLKPESLAAHGGRSPDAERGDVAPPLRPSTNYARDQDYRQIGGQGGYSRADSPSYPDIESLPADYFSHLFGDLLRRAAPGAVND